MARAPQRVLSTIAFTVLIGFVLSTAMPAGAVQPGGSFPLPSLAGAFEWGDASRGLAGIPVQKAGDPDKRGHYVNSASPAAQRPPLKRPKWESPAALRGFDRATSVRVPEKSSASSDVYRNADGTITRRESTGRVNYKDRNGRWQPIDPTLVPAAGQRIQSKANDVVVSFSAPKATGAGGSAATVAQAAPVGELVTVTLPTGEVFAYSLQGSFSVTPVVDGATAWYRDILPNLDVELRSTETGVKEDLILKNRDAGNSWVFPLRLKGLTPRLTEHGSIELVDSAGKVALDIPHAYMEDSAPVGERGEHPTSSNVSYELITVDGGPALRVTADAAWLSDPARVWPVRLDPTTKRTDDMADVFVDNESDTHEGSQNGSSLAVGRHSGGIARSFMAFERFAADGFLGKRMLSAQLALHLTWTNTCNTYQDIYVHRITSSWSVVDLDDAGLASSPSYSSPIGSLKITDHTPACTNTGGDRSVGQWHKVPLNIATLHDWSIQRDGDSDWYKGLALTASESVTTSWKRFTSANYSAALKPYLELTYVDNIAPQVNSLHPGWGTQSPTLTPQLLVDAVDPDGFPASMEYNFEIFSEDNAGVQTAVGTSGWLKTNTWTVPAGMLKWGGRYRWHATAHDGRSNNGVPSFTWQPTWRHLLTTPVPQTAITSTLSSNGDSGFAPGSGNYTNSVTDAQVDTAGPPLTIQRSYNSMDPRTSGAFGPGWSSLLDAKAVENKDVAGVVQTVTVTYPAGQEIAFGDNRDGTFSTGSGRYATFIRVGTSGYSLVDKAGTTYLFTELLGTGQFGLTSVADAYGRKLTAAYTAGKVAKLTAASGRNLHLTWTGGQVSKVETDPAIAGDSATVATWNYEYTSGQLTKVCSPTSATLCTAYSYADINRYASTVENIGASSYWRLNETSGTEARSSALTQLGTDVGTYSNVALGQPGPLSATAAGFNGTSSHIVLPARLNSQSGSQTVSMWFKTSAAGDQVLYGQSWDPITQASTSGAYHPALYVGQDGKLAGGFPVKPLPGSLGSLLSYGSGLCVDIEGRQVVKGKDLVLASCDGAATQQWALTAAGNLTVTSGGVTMCVDTNGILDSARVVLWDCHSGSTEIWDVTADGKLMSLGSGKCLDLPSFAAGTRLIIWPCHTKPYSLSQTWNKRTHAPIQTSVNVADGQWHHVTLSAGEDRQTIYVDGVAAGTQTNVAISDIGARYQYVGAGFLGGGWPNQSHVDANKNTGVPDFFNGSIAEISVFDRPLTASVVAELYSTRGTGKALSQITRPSGGVTAQVVYDGVSGRVNQVTDSDGGVWKLNATTVNGSSQVYSSAVLGGSPADYWRLNDLPGTYEPVNEINASTATYGGPTLGGPGAMGPFADTLAPLFDGVDDNVTVPGALDVTGSFTWSGWVNMGDPAGRWRGVVGKNGNRAPAFNIAYDPSANKWYSVVCSSDVDSPTCPLVYSTSTATRGGTADTWVHLASTYDKEGTTLRFYVNGVLQGSVGNATPFAATGPMTIGDYIYQGVSTVDFPGRIAEVATYRSKLSDAQILAQYQAADRVKKDPNALLMPAKIVTVTDPGNKTLSEAYSLHTGQQVTSTDALGNTTKFGYDGVSGFMDTMTDPNGNKTEYRYDVRGNVIEQSTWQVQTSDTTKSTTRFTYYPDATTKLPPADPRNDKLLTIRDPRPEGYLTQYTYDAAGNQTEIIDPLDRKHTSVYANGQVTKELTPGGAVTEYTYLSNGDLEKTVDATGLVTWFTYDALGQVLTKKVVSSTFPNGLTTSYEYDKQGRVRTLTEPGVLNRITGATHTAIHTTQYDPDGFVLSDKVSDSTGGDAPRTVSYGYNDKSQKTSLTDGLGKVSTYTYDIYGRQRTQTDPTGNTAETVRDAEGHLLTVKVKSFTGDPDNPSAAADVTAESHAYDSAGRLVSTTDAMNWVTEREYTSNNLLKKVTRVDGANRFVLEDNTYDKAGNLIQQVTNNGATTTTFTVDAAARPMSATLDPAGLNRTSSFTADLDDNPLSTTVKAGAGAVMSYSEASYDAQGRPLSQTTYPSTQLTPVARWKLDSSAADSAGNNPGVGSNVSWSGGVAQFNGTSSYVEALDQVVDATQSFAVSAWVTLADKSTDRTIVTKDASGYASLYFQYHKSSDRWLAEMPSTTAGQSWSRASSQSVPQLGARTHLASVYDATAKTLKLYVNGVLEGTATSVTTFNDPKGKFWIGRAGSNWFSGGIDDVQAYQKALSAAEVTSVYNGSAPAADAKVLRTSYVRDEAGNVRQMIDPKGNVTHYEVDEDGHPTVVTSAPVTSETYGSTPVTASPVSYAGYDTFGAQTHAKDATGNETIAVFDGAGQVAKVRYPAYTASGSPTPLNPEVSYTYDDAGQATKVTDPLGNFTTYTYDQLGRVTKQSNPDGGVTRVQHNLAGNVLSVTDPMGAQQTATWDYLGRQLTGTQIVRQTSANHTTTYGYAPSGWLSSVTSPDGVRSETTYNAAGEKATVKDGANATTTFAYDGMGRVVKTTLADSTYSTVDYDLAGRTLAQKAYSATGALLRTKSAAYDSSGNVVSTTDGRGTTTTLGYDATNLLVSQTEPVSASESITSTFGYDAAGRRTRFTDGRGNAYWSAYNTMGLIESQIEPATSAHPNLSDRTFTTSYDAAGRAVHRALPGGVTQTHTYDVAGRLTRSAGAGAAASTMDRRFDYDLAGRTSMVSGSGGDNTLAWDDRGLLASITGPSGNNTFTYTADSTLKTRQDAAGTTTYGYDTAGRLASMSNSDSDVQMALGYNAISQVVQVTHGSGGNTRWLGYDPLHQLTSDELKTSGGTSIGKIAYAFDGNGNLTSKATTGFAGAASNTYTYDLANRLTSWFDGSASTAYAYDKAGNRTQAGARTFSYNERNQLVSSSAGTSYQYTARGSMAGQTTGTVALATVADAFDQVTRQYTSDTAFAEYSYDGLGRAIKPGFSYTGIGNDLAADGTATYTRDPAGGLVGVKQAGAGEYAWTDAHTDVVGQFTATGTTLTGSSTFDPLGKVVASSSSVGNLGYQQEFTEQSTGRVNMHARWYNTDTGQFDNRDTADVSPNPLSGAANRYAYAGGNPLTRTDPSGNDFIDNCSGIFSCLVKGFVNSFDFKKMWDDFKGAISNLRETVSNMIGGIKQDADKWRGKLKKLMPSGVCSGLHALTGWKLDVCDGAAKLGGWACALSGVCELVENCTGGNLNQCAEDAGEALADALIGLISGGAAAVARRIAKRVASLIRKFGLRDNRKEHQKDRDLTDPHAFNGDTDIDDIKKHQRKNPVKTGKNCSMFKGGICPGSKPKPKPKPKPKTKPTAKPTPKPKPTAKPKPKPTAKSPSRRPQPAGPSCKKHSFDPSTKVLMADGTVKAISDIKVGERVTAADPLTGATSSQLVTVLHENVDTELTEVTVSTSPPSSSTESSAEGKGGRSTRGPTQTATLKTTANHPFWDATTKTWIDAAKLEPGKSTLIGPNGEIQYVTAVRNLTGSKVMRDLTVDVIHTYYVVAGETPVLVHNCGTGNGPLRGADGRFEANPNTQPRPVSDGTHGNSLDSTRPTTLYQLTDTATGAHLKWGITSEVNPMARYSSGFMRGKTMDIIATGTRRDMTAHERFLTSRWPGPLNDESWAGSIPPFSPGPFD